MGAPEDVSAEALEEILDMLIQKEPWKEQAACRTVNRGNFFLNRGQSSAVARRACAKCPVRIECEEYANRNSLEGWWGGRLHKASEKYNRGPVQSQIQDVRLRPSTKTESGE